MSERGPDPETIGALATRGFAVVEAYFDDGLCAALAAETAALATDPDAIDAGLGRGRDHVAMHAIRQTRIRWLDGRTDAQARFLAAAEQVRLAVNRDLFLGLWSFEAQLALTPPGGFYRRHLDSFRGARNRVVSLVAYLDADWTLADGGCLRVWPPASADDDGAPPTLDIAPRRGTMVMMLSEQVPHEVLPTRRPRASLAGWFRVAG